MTKWVLILIVSNVVMFLLQMTNPAVTAAFAYIPLLALERPWTIITYMFLHGGWSHLFFNMIGLFFFGPRLEVFLGERRFLMLYFLSGIVGAALHSVFGPGIPIIGASGAVYGIFMGFAYFWPREQILIWGVFPVQARWMVLAMTILSLYGGFGAADGIAHFAHLGGYLGAFLYLRWLTDRLNRPAREQSAPRLSSSDLQRWKSIDRTRLHEVNREEFDRILRKLESGDTRLTEAERAFLERFGGG